MVSMQHTQYVDDIREIKEENPFESMMSRFDRAAQLLNLDADLYAVMRVPNRELKVYIPTRMDSGRIQVFEGYRVQHNFAHLVQVYVRRISNAALGRPAREVVLYAIALKDLDPS